MHSHRSTWIAALLVSAGALALFVATLAPTVTFVDSGELIVVAQTLGVAHPPGFPLYTLLAHAATWLPVGTVAERVHLVSAVFAALTSGVVVLLVHEIARCGKAATLPRNPRGRRGRRPSDGTGAASRPAWVALGAAAAAGLLVASSRTLWAYATVAEVYTLNAFLVLAAVLLLVRWRRQALGTADDEQAPPRNLALYGAAALVGLALAVHHVTVVLMMPACAWLAWTVARARPVGIATWLRAGACAAAGLLLYLYLPLAASTSPLVNWGDPDTPGRLWWHVTGRQYQVYFSFSIDTMARQFGDVFVPYLMREFGPAWLPLALVAAVAGFGRLRRDDSGLAVALALILVVDVGYALNYEIDEDKDAYYLPAFLTLAVAAGLGAARVLAAAARRPAAQRAALAALVAAAPAVALTANWPFNDRGEYRLARDYVDNVLSTVETGGLLLTRDWQVYSPWLYARHVDAVRPDAVVIDVNLLRRTWYFDYLEREYPGTMANVRTETAEYLEDLRQWDRDPDLYQRDLRLNRRISQRFDTLVTALIETHRATRPAYVTLDLLAQDAGIAAALSRYTAVPQGLVFELADGAGFVPVAEPDLRLRGLFDGSIAFEPDDVVRQKVRPAYVAMIVNRGRYFAAHGRVERAEAAYRQALALEPDNAVARASLAALGDTR